MSVERPKRLGRGLEALISGANRTVPESEPAPANTTGVRSELIQISRIRPNPYQPRKEFKPEELRELEASLRQNGLLQPITVRRSKSADGFELAAGERRLRAATNIGWTEIPAIVRTLSDQELLAVALVENLQRSDLNPIEEAEGYARLVADYGLTQQAVAEAVGKERSTVANLLRLLSLPEPVKVMLRADQLTLGHARALLGFPSETEMVTTARAVVTDGLSVREVERRVRDRKPTPPAVSEKATRAPVADSGPEVRRIEGDLRRYFQTDAKLLLTGRDRGTISLAFYSADDLERLLDILLKRDS